MANIIEALNALNVGEYSLRGTPATEAEFNQMFAKVTGADSEGTAIESSNPNDFGVTWSQVSAKLAELQAEYDSKQYQRDRADSYPAIGDQLDMLFHAIDAGKVDKTSDFYKSLKAVKDKYPKG